MPCHRIGYDRHSIHTLAVQILYVDREEEKNKYLDLVEIFSMDAPPASSSPSFATSWWLPRAISCSPWTCTLYVFFYWRASSPPDLFASRLFCLFFFPCIVFLFFMFRSGLCCCVLVPRTLTFHLILPINLRFILLWCFLLSRGLWPRHTSTRNISINKIATLDGHWVDWCACG